MNISNNYVKKLVQLVLELSAEKDKPENYGIRPKMITMIDYLSGYVDVLKEPSETNTYCIAANEKRTKVTEELFNEVRSKLPTKTRKELHYDYNISSTTVYFIANSPTYQDYKRYLDRTRLSASKRK